MVDIILYLINDTRNAVGQSFGTHNTRGFGRFNEIV